MFPYAYSFSIKCASLWIFKMHTRRKEQLQAHKKINSMKLKYESARMALMIIYKSGIP